MAMQCDESGARAAVFHKYFWSASDPSPMLAVNQEIFIAITDKASTARRWGSNGAGQIFSPATFRLHVTDGEPH